MAEADDAMDVEVTVSQPRGETLAIDTELTFSEDTSRGKVPDMYSATLRSYHRLLWSKPLPSGAMFTLVEDTPPGYLRHSSALGEFALSSDFMMGNFSNVKAAAKLRNNRTRWIWDRYARVAPTMGGRIIWPGKRVDGQDTINQRRGMHVRIKDRFDLTLECVRRYYRGDNSPLADTLARYPEFFDLFDDFTGYVNFFLLQDFLNADGTVRMQHDFDNFTALPIPDKVEDYDRYLMRCTELLHARNARICQWCRDNLANAYG